MNDAAMTGYFDAVPTDAEGLNTAVDLSTSSRRQVRDVLLSGGAVGSLTDNIGAVAGRKIEQAQEWAGAKPVKMLTPDQANARFGLGDNLRFTADVSESEALHKFKAKSDELYRQDVLSRNDKVGAIEGFGYALVGGIVDPVSLGLNFVPIAGEARWGKVLADAGLAGRMAKGAWIGAQGGVLGEGLTWASAAEQGKVYGPEDAAMGILSSAVFGAGFEGVGYGLKQAGKAVSTGGKVSPVEAMVRQEAEARGINPELAATIARVESNFNPNAKNKSGAAGVYQFMPETWARMGGGDVHDAPTNIARGLDLIEENAAQLRRMLGREPSDAEIYLAHQQGVAGARRLIENPDQSAVEVLAGLTEKGKPIGLDRARQRVVQNGGRADMTAGEFVAKWAEPFGGSVTPPPQWTSVRAPDTVARMDVVDQASGISAAIDQFGETGRVDMGDLIEEAVRKPRATASMDEVGSDIKIPARTYETDVAVTPRGSEIGVKYAIVEARHLITSHDDDLVKNPDFPDEMQPRQRDRAGSQARLKNLEAEFNPRLLTRDVSAAAGAPIISPDGVVESGNGRAIVLRRGSDRGADYYKRYRDHLTSEGFDVSGFEQPALVRVRTEPLSGPDRVRLSREMNADVVERMSVPEQAFVDAEAMGPSEVGLYQGGAITQTHNDAFVRAFVGKAGAGGENALIDAGTKRLSQEGQERIEAAMVAKAYGDRSLVAAIYESASPQIKALGRALADVAPEWAKMREAAASGELAAGADTTQYLTEAIAFVRHTRDERLNLADRMDNLRDQPGLFGVDALTPEAAAYVDLFYTDGTFRTQRKADLIAEDLRDMANAAMETQAGPDLFGEVRSYDVSSQISVVRERSLKEGRNDAEQFIDEFRTGNGPDGDGAWVRSDSGAPGSASRPGLLDLSGDASGQAVEGRRVADRAEIGQVGFRDGDRKVKPGDYELTIRRGNSFTLKPTEQVFEGASGSGGIEGTIDDSGAWQIKMSEIADGARGRGVGSEMYRVLVNEAIKEKADLFSDGMLTQSAFRIWESLKKRGLRVERSNAARYDETYSSWSTTNGEPVFKLPYTEPGGADRAGGGQDVKPEPALPIISDPEIKALEAELQGLRDEGFLGEADPFDKPENLTRAVIAYAACLIKEVGA